MNLYYLDTSAVVKYYYTEQGSEWVRQIVGERDGEKSNRLYIAEIAIAEGAAAFAILARTKQIRAALRDALYRQFLEDVHTEYRPVHVRREEIDRAAELTQRHDLKGYDAVQLAVALYVNDLLRADDLSLIFVSGDDNLLHAAQAEGLATENPFDHRDLDNAQ